MARIVDAPATSYLIINGSQFEPVTPEQLRALEPDQWLELSDNQAGSSVRRAIFGITDLDLNPEDKSRLKFTFWCIGQDGQRYFGQVTHVGYTYFTPLRLTGA